jgi:hypothetical protein
MLNPDDGSTMASSVQIEKKLHDHKTIQRIATYILSIDDSIILCPFVNKEVPELRVKNELGDGKAHSVKKVNQYLIPVTDVGEIDIKCEKIFAENRYDDASGSSTTSTQQTIQIIKNYMSGITDNHQMSSRIQYGFKDLLVGTDEVLCRCRVELEYKRPIVMRKLFYIFIKCIDAMYRLIPQIEYTIQLNYINILSKIQYRKFQYETFLYTITHLNSISNLYQYIALKLNGVRGKAFISPNHFDGGYRSLTISIDDGRILNLSVNFGNKLTQLACVVLLQIELIEETVNNQKIFKLYIVDFLGLLPISYNNQSNYIIEEHTPVYTFHLNDAIAILETFKYKTFEARNRTHTDDDSVYTVHFQIYAKTSDSLKNDLQSLVREKNDGFIGVSCGALIKIKEYKTIELKWTGDEFISNNNKKIAYDDRGSSVKRLLLKTNSIYECVLDEKCTKCVYVMGERSDRFISNNI